MKRLLCALILSIPPAGPALADPCDSLINTIETALASPETTYAQRIELDALLNAGRAAKAAGNTQFCEEQVTSTPGQLPQSVPSGGDDSKCKGSPNAV